MADASRLDELERKFAENPRRYFAPLANEHRKSGDLATAIAICRQQLARYPGHMSGHVVLGQALYESRQPEEAQTAFERALALDPENLIALRHLGDIARDRGDGVAARAWYQRVLEADPRNDDIAAQLQRLAPAPVAPPAEVVPTAFVAPPPAPAPILEPLEWSALDLELPGEAAPSPEPAPGPAPVEPSISETAELPVAEGESAPQAPRGPWPEDVGDHPVPQARETSPDGMPVLEPVDWMDLLPEHGTEASEEPEPAAESAEAPPVDEPPVDELRGEDESATDEPLISTIEEIWVAAPSSPAVEPEPTVDHEPEAEEVAEPLAAAELPHDVDEPAADPAVPDATPVAGEPVLVEPAEFEPAEFEPVAPDGSFDMILSATLDPSLAEGEPTTAATAESESECWLDAMPVDLSPDGVELPTIDDATAAADDVGARAPLAQDVGDADAPLVEDAPAYDPVVGLDLPPIPGDEPEPYPEPPEAPRSPTPTGVPSVAFMTETMAGLLLQQGHVDQALEVYDCLLGQRPDDEALAARVAALRAQSTDGQAPEPEPAQRPPDVPSSPEVPAGATAGAFFAALAAAPAIDASPEQGAAEEIATGAAATDAPTCAPVAEAVTDAPAPFGGLFGGAGSDADEHAARRLAGGFTQPATPMASFADALFLSPPSLPPAAMPATPAEPAAAAPYGMGDFSFERFFEGLEEGTVPEAATETPAPQPTPAEDPWAVPQAAPAAPARAATPAAPQPATDAAPAPSTTDDEDLAQFHAWLKGLMDS